MNGEMTTDSDEDENVWKDADGDRYVDVVLRINNAGGYAGHEDYAEVPAEVDTLTGDVRFVLEDGTPYDSKTSDLRFGETEPTRRKHQIESFFLTMMTMDQNPELFKKSHERLLRNSREVPPEENEMFLINVPKHSSDDED